ncbi:MAG: hypothetical protein E6X49_23240 [Leclercia adecarboxylata]|nr:hypothetical protein [uncultured Leclercia sp.]MDU4844033.1 hypothetical protein [Leclercia adecarboxylata]
MTNKITNDQKGANRLPLSRAAAKMKRIVAGVKRLNATLEAGKREQRR